METVIINAFGGPGCGKTTFAWELASLLKKLNILVEYVPEYAKELVYEERFDILDNTAKNQLLIFKEQSRRLDRLIGKVRVVITDSPLLLSITYAKDATEDFKNNILEKFNSYNNLNIYIERGQTKFIQAGRKENFLEAKNEDDVIYNFLKENDIDFVVYDKLDIGYIIDEIINLLGEFDEDNIN